MALSGQTTVTTAGSAVQLGDQPVGAALQVKALDTNTGIVAIGNDYSDNSGDVTLSTGLRLAAGQSAIFDYVGNLASIWLDAAVNGEGVSWLVLVA